MSYVDLYLIHHPSVVRRDMAGAWRKMERLKADGKAKLGVLTLCRVVCLTE